MKIMNVDNLPKTYGFGMNTNRLVVDWENSIGLKCKFTYDDIDGEIEIIDYASKKQDLYVRYISDEIFRIKTSNFLKCGIAKILKIITTDYKVEIGGTFKDDKRDLLIIDRYKMKNKNNSTVKYYKYHCNKCGNEDTFYESQLITSNQSCNACCSPPKKLLLGVNTIWDKARWMCDLGVSEEDAKKYMPNSTGKIKVICPHCGFSRSVKPNFIYTSHSIGCKCRDGKSFGEKYMFCMLKTLMENDIISCLELEKTYDWCNYFNTYKNKICNGFYDFVIENEKLIIEVDGGFHRAYNTMSGQTEEESKFIDMTKDKLATCHDYVVIRVSDEGDIQTNILNSKLNSIYDLSIINWEECFEFGCKNIAKEVCDYWRENINNEISVAKLSCIFEVSKSAIRSYLHKGNKYGWCNYDGAKAQRKRAKHKGHGKKIEVFKDNKSIGIFESCVELDRISKEVLGVKLLKESISMTAIGKKETYKGFTFRYI